MGLLSRLRAWITGSDGETSDGAETGTTETDDRTGEPRLDPENVTEVRRGSDEDPVETLRAVREEGNGAGVDEER
jgi:hypothetical protein